MTRDQIRAALTDPTALVCTLYGEARNEPIGAQIAVGCAIRNRVQADLGGDGKPDWWGETFKGVCLAKWQFSCWWETNANSDRVYALAEALIQKQPVGDASLIAELQWIAHGLIENQLRDHVNGADHYLTTALLRTRPPTWVGAMRPVAVVGAHSFFRA